MGLDFSRIDTGKLYPPLMTKLEAVAAALEGEQIHYYATSGYRSFADQAALYAQGRTKPGNIVTRARPGQSAHNYGLAVDFCRDAAPATPGLQPDWQSEDYRPIALAAREAGLEPGLLWPGFKDAPHIQWSIPFSWDQLIHWSEDGQNIPAVWTMLGDKRRN